MDPSLAELGIHYAMAAGAIDECQCKSGDDCDGDCVDPPSQCDCNDCDGDCKCT